MGKEQSIPGFKKLWQLIYRLRKEVSALYFYAIFSGLLQLVVPLGIQSIVGFVLGAQMVSSVYLLIGLVILSVSFVGILQIKQMRVVEGIQQQLFAKEAFQFSETIPNIDLQQAEQYYLPEKANRFFDTVVLQKGIAKLLLDTPQALIQIVLGLTLLCFYHPVFIVFSFLLCLILGLLFYFSGKQGIRSSIEESNYKYAVVDWLEDLARVIRSFKFSQGSHLNLQKTDDQVVHYLQARNKHFGVLLFQYRSLLVLKIIITATMLIAGTVLLIDQKLTVGEFIAAEIVILTIIAAVEKLITNLENVYDVITSLEKLHSVTELPKEQSGELILQNTTLPLSISLKDLSFSYPNQLPVLQHLSMDIPAGARVAITGPEGSGKSTLLQILAGMLHHFNGHYLLHNVPIQQYNLQSFREISTYYAHKQDIFKGSVRDNITLRRPGLDSEHIYTLADQLGITAFLYALPQGLDTEVHSEGQRFPSTQLKKILLLRSLIHRPQLMLMEEPWYGLKKEEKEQVMQYLLNQKKHTLVIVTNDPLYHQHCDKIISLPEGNIVINSKHNA